MLIKEKNILIVFLFIFIFALIIGFYFRVNGISEVGFAGDEETTVLATLGIEENGIPSFPSGMPYYRAIPHSYLLHIIFKVFGIGEFQARLPSLIFGTLLIIFTTYLGYTIYPNIFFSLTAGIFFALNCYQIELARTARMYEPFLFFFTIYLIFVFKYLKNSNTRYLFWSVIFFIFTISFHTIGIFGIFFLAIQFFFKKENKEKLAIFISCSLMAMTWIALFYFINTGYAFFEKPVESNLSEGTQFGLFFLFQHHWYIMIINLILLGFLTYFKKLEISIKNLIFLLVYFLFILGFVHLAWILVLLIIIWNKKLDLKIISTSIFGIITSILFTLNNYLILHSIKQTIKITFSYPFFSEPFFIQKFPIFFLSLLVFYLFFKFIDQQEIKYIVISILTSIIALSCFDYSFAYRYVIFLMPLMILLYSFFIFVILKNVNRIVPKLLLIIIALVLIFHETSPLNYFISYFDVDYGSLKYPGNHPRPDHKGAAEFVKERLSAEDIVVSVDALQTKYYLGRVDYWLRDKSDLNQFLYLSNSNEIRDIYVNSKPIETGEEILSLINTGKTVWLIDSGETFTHPSLNIKFDIRRYYLQKSAVDFIKNAMSKLVYQGRDGYSNVYKFN